MSMMGNAEMMDFSQKNFIDNYLKMESTVKLENEFHSSTFEDMTDVESVKKALLKTFVVRIP